MPIGKLGGVSASAAMKPIMRDQASANAQGVVSVLRGTVFNISTELPRFTLQGSSGVHVVAWSAATSFRGLDRTNLQGQEVMVQGRMVQGEMLAAFVRPVR